MNPITIYKLIESKRSELNTLASIYGVRDQRILVKSVQLDRIINVYMKKFQKEKIEYINNQNDKMTNSSRTKELIGML
ncbi:aspartyl-phosphate phosphatase Spo0E family protein [Paenibacillus sp. IHBB 10380]|uniref:aspartyl-phosphate phosphatase Spo0E family protein n=1 Tax=Paenibacillus sp. IHBB 10380 TaxID=1566358 RepID=UPI0005CFE9B8|nr:aspartyl-phosphate phosphatase Spo0E family protein [Paenibacillus sp. IHBB 10380]AJS58910.1 hypothetical protein UB51_10950 [Paenibacillus sp. IHBB 10380]